MHPFLIAALLATAPATGTAGRPAASSVPTMAVEDTMRTEVPEVLVRAPRVTLDEILSRVARGEARRESLMTDQTFTITIRVVGRVEDPKKPPKLLVENVVRVYKKRPGKVRSVLLRNYRPKPDKKGDDPDIQIRTGMDEEIVNFAFRPEARRVVVRSRRSGRRARNPRECHADRGAEIEAGRGEREGPAVVHGEPGGPKRSGRAGFLRDRRDGRGEEKHERGAGSTVKSHDFLLARAGGAFAGRTLARGVPKARGFPRRDAWPRRSPARSAALGPLRNLARPPA